MTPNVPDGFPINTIGVMRALCAVAASHPEKLTQAFEAIYHAVWAEGKPAQKPEIWEGILEEVLGGEAARGVVEKVCAFCFLLLLYLVMNDGWGSLMSRDRLRRRRRRIS